MVDPQKCPKLVGNFIRKRREALGISQRALGLLFHPPVTTQFISNVERGITPLPPAHVPILIQALGIPEEDLLNLLEREFTLKLSSRVGRPQESADPHGNTSHHQESVDLEGALQLSIEQADFDFMKNVYQAYRYSDSKTKQAFITVCENMFPDFKG